MLIVLDTNVLYQATQSGNGASNYILRLIRNRKINIAVSIPAFIEYESVLKRKKSLKHFGLTVSDIDKILDLIAYAAKPVNIHYLFRPNLKDESDNVFIELAIASNCEFLITNNVKDFTINKELTFKGLKIATPSEFVKFWRQNYEN